MTTSHRPPVHRQSIQLVPPKTVGQTHGLYTYAEVVYESLLGGRSRTNKIAPSATRHHFAVEGTAIEAYIVLMLHNLLIDHATPTARQQLQHTIHLDSIPKYEVLVHENALRLRSIVGLSRCLLHANYVPNSRKLRVIHSDFSDQDTLLLGQAIYQHFGWLYTNSIPPTALPNTTSIPVPSPSRISMGNRLRDWR
ncbi:MAG: hypothetical protein KME20_01370 [Kaiparowitsia implicata GSE-PSE-MK54-09C]|jgi:hypothetical protein|nr:hypothetical protein [Kaiparowitsia implicata GSE-PSE-MK54-09C]